MDDLTDSELHSLLCEVAILGAPRTTADMHRLVAEVTRLRHLQELARAQAGASRAVDENPDDQALAEFWVETTQMLEEAVS